MLLFPFHHAFSIIVLCYFCFLNIHTGSISSVADFFFPQFPPGHGLFAVIISGAGNPCPATACVFIYFLPFAYEVFCEWSLWQFSGNRQAEHFKIQLVMESIAIPQMILALFGLYLNCWKHSCFGQKCNVTPFLPKPAWQKFRTPLSLKCQYFT